MSDQCRQCFFLLFITPTSWSFLCRLIVPMLMSSWIVSILIDRLRYPQVRECHSSGSVKNSFALSIRGLLEFPRFIRAGWVLHLIHTCRTLEGISNLNSVTFWYCRDVTWFVSNREKEHFIVFHQSCLQTLFVSRSFMRENFPKVTMLQFVKSKLDSPGFVNTLLEIALYF